MQLRAFFAGVLTLAASSILYGQQDQGVITGTVMDSTASVIPGAAVSIREMNTGIVVEKQSNESGIYVSGPLKVGLYEVSVSTEGFKRSVRSGVEIHAGDRIGLNFNLEVGNVVEVIEVTGATPLLETESATLAYTVLRLQPRASIRRSMVPRWPEPGLPMLTGRPAR